jgi:3-oxoacyl-[acyl-carrier protein] reductase
LHAEGCRLAINARGPEGLEATASSLGDVAAVAGDVSDPEVSKRVIGHATQALGGLDILICNVGSGRSVPPGEETAPEWQRMFALNLWSVTNAIEAARDPLIASRGCVVCVSSICGAEVVPGAPVTYSAAKAALNAYVRGIARPLGKHGVRINAVAPGNIAFDGSVWARKLATDPAAVDAMLERSVSLGRLGTPREVAQLVAYLASPRAAFASGAVWTLDGGQIHS